MRITFDKITKTYGQTVAVSSLNLCIEEGALHFLLGPSGCGKTTTLRMLAGLEEVTSGKLYFNDRDVTTLQASERGIGMVFQNYALWPHMTVRQNIEYGLKLRKLTHQELKRRVDEVLDATHLERFASRLPGQLSGGQQQRVALARALAIRPSVLLLDEPLSNLDAKLRLEMRDNIARIHRETGITTVYVTHDQKEALSMGTHISVMYSGHMIQSGSPRDLYRNPRSSFIAEFIGETNLLPGKVIDAKDGELLVETAMGKIVSKHVMIEGRPDTLIHKDVVLSLRPESIFLAESLQEGHMNHMNLKLSHSTYLGEMEQLNLVICSERALFMKANIFNAKDQLFERDMSVALTIDPAHVTCLPAEQNIGQST